MDRNRLRPWQSGQIEQGMHGQRYWGILSYRIDVGMRHQDAHLAGEYRLAAAIEEEIDVRVFLGFGDAQLLHAGFGDDLAEGAAQILRREQRRHEAVQLGRILDEAERGGESDALLPLEAREIGIEQ